MGHQGFVGREFVSASGARECYLSIDVEPELVFADQLEALRATYAAAELQQEAPRRVRQLDEDAGLPALGEHGEEVGMIAAHRRKQSRGPEIERRLRRRADERARQQARELIILHCASARLRRLAAQTTERARFSPC